MSAQGAWVSGVGAATSLGNVVQAAAAARAGLARPAGLPSCLHFDEATNDPEPVVGHPAAWLTDGFEGDGRLAQLAEAALDDLLRACGPVEAARTLVFVSLPACGDAARLAARVREGSALGAGPAAAFPEERRGTTRALQEAMDALARGACDHAVVVACDSLVEPARAGELLQAGRLKTPDHPVGFMPGEAAAAVLLERRARGAAMSLSAPATAEEANGFAAGIPSTGRALTGVVLRALHGQEGRGAMYVDLNGENRRASEWGHVLVRARASLEGFAQRVPALSFGETGTAAPLLALCLAVRAAARGADDGAALLVCSADDGHRAAMVLRRGGER